MKNLKTNFGLLFVMTVMLIAISSCTNDDDNLESYEKVKATTTDVDPIKIKPPTGG